MDLVELKKCKMEFNRKNFIEDIVNIDFEGDLKKCAETMGFSVAGLRKLIYADSSGGKESLDKIYKYCKKTNRDPEKYIFVKQ